MPRLAPRRPPPLRRISSLDASNLRVESRGMPMTVAALAMLEPADGLVDASGDLDMETIRRHVASRVAGEPRLRQVLFPTRWWQGPPVWVPDARFDIASRVRRAAVPAPHDEATLLKLCGELSRPGLDPTRSPWELWVVNGCEDGSLAMLLRLHHVMADGAAALELFSTLFDPAPEPPPPAGGMPGGRPPGIPPAGRGPTAGRLFADNQRRVLATFWHGARRFGGRLRRPALLVHRLGGGVQLVKMLVAHGRAPALSFNRPVTAGPRELSLVRADLAAAKAAAHACGGTVNDLLLAVIAHGVRALLAERGELVPGLVLHVSVPASLRAAGEAGGSGNRVAVRPMWVALDEGDPSRRLAALAPATKAVRRLPPLQPSGALGQRWVVRVMKRQRLVNLILSNVAGPTGRLWFAGVRVRELFQIGAAGVQGNLAITVGALSYAGRLNLDVAADAALVPDIQAFTQGVRDALDHLGCLPHEAGDRVPAPGGERTVRRQAPPVS